jgi:hypothetical protein
MEKLNWIKELVDAERSMEESGIIDFSAGFDPDKSLKEETSKFMHDIKSMMVEYATAFNQLKGIALGGVKIYGISNTECDFMLFRNGFKLIFTATKPGRVSVRFHYQGAGFVPGQKAAEEQSETLPNDDVLEARWGAFGQLVWTHKELEVRKEYLTRYYLSRFIRESAK